MAGAKKVPLIAAIELNPRPEQGSLLDELEVSFVPMAAVEAGSGRMEASTVRKYGEVKKGYTFFREDDVLFAKITPCMENGKMVVARGLRNGVGCGSTEFHVLRPRPGVDPDYVYYFVSSARFRAEAAHHMTGAVGQKRVPAAFLERCEIPLPELDEQRRVVAGIEKQFSRLDEAVANLKRVKANLKRYKAAILKAAVEGRLVAGTDSVQEGATVMEGTCARSGLPSEWRWSSVGELARVGTGATPNRSKASYWREGDVPWVTSAVVNEPYVDAATEFVTQAALAETNLTLYPPGTLLVAMYGEGKTRGKCTELRIPATTNQALAALQVDEGLRPYLKLFLDHSYEDMRKVASGGVQPNLNLGLVRALRVPLPPLAEQRRIVAEADRRLSIFREVESEVEANLKRAMGLRSSVLQSHFKIRDEECV